MLEKWNDEPSELIRYNEAEMIFSIIQPKQKKNNKKKF